jgi:ATP-binding cassette subfamily F protein 3
MPDDAKILRIDKRQRQARFPHVADRTILRDPHIRHVGLTRHGNRVGVDHRPIRVNECIGRLGPHDRIGLVGPNGTGKSTLLKILVGEVQADDGSIGFRRKTRVGYLPQELQSLASGTLVESVMSAVPGRDSIEQRLSSLAAQLEVASETSEQLELAEELACAHEEFDHFEAHFGKHRAEQILLGLGFRTADFSKATTAFSGGWRMRAALASLLLQDPELLLLDEPTNHLDVPTLAWFDGFLKRSRKALVLITHDREFLNRQISRVLSLEPEGLRSWTGNYEDYRRLRAEEYERLLAESEKQSQKRAQLTAFVNRFRAKASKAAQAQSKMKQLEKMETIELHQERDTVSFEFPKAPQSGREVVRFKGIDKSFGSNVIYRNLDAQVLRGQRIAVVGLNGAGKTTLLKLLAGELEPDGGSVALGHNVTMGYYAQHHADVLDRRRTILEELRTLVPDKSQGWVRAVLGAFLFSGDDVDKPIGVLSGGERARVALARLLLKPSNLLVMDEPTNHLDLESSEALIEALEGYEGTLMFVSHNRSFLNRLATHIWDVVDQKVVAFPGTLDEYFHHLELDAARKESGGAACVSVPAPAQKDRKRLEAEARQARSRRIGPLKKEIAALEGKIAATELAQKHREAQLIVPEFAADFEKARPVMEAHREATDELEALLGRWEQANQELSVAENDA